MNRDYTINFNVQAASQYAQAMREIRDAMASMLPIAQQVQQTMRGFGAEADGAKTHTRSLTEELGGFVTKAMLLNEAKKLIGEIGEVFKANREYAHDVAEEYSKLVERLRELANLRGQDTAKTAKQFMGAMTRTPATAAELATLS